MEYLTTTTF